MENVGAASLTLDREGWKYLAVGPDGDPDFDAVLFGYNRKM